MHRMSRSIMSAFAIDPIQLDPGINTRTSRIQILYGAWVNMTQLAIGLAMGFASVLISHLENESEISVTGDDASWIASAMALCCPIGCVISGIAMDRHGRRVMLIFSQAPMFFGWLCTGFAKTSNMLIIGRAITGIGCGMAMVPPRAYCTEISLPNIRGVIGSFPNVAVGMGITVQAALGTFLNWHILCYICSAFTLINFCSFTFLPESPYFLLQNNSEQEARDTLAKFRGPNYDVDREMDTLRDFKEDIGFRKISCAENMAVVFTKASCKPFVLVIIYVFLSQAVGNSLVLNWTIDLLVEANSSLDAGIGNILLGLTRMVMSGVTAALLYKVGRRPLALMSAIGVALVCFVLGVFLIANDIPSLVPAISLIMYTACSALGYYNLPTLIGFELYPLQVRGILGGATMSLYSILMFASTKVKPLIMDLLGLPYMFVMFGCFSLLETKDLTLQEIEEYYKEIRPALVSQRRIISMSQAGMMSRAAMSKPRFSGNKSKMGLQGPKSAKPSAPTQLSILDTTKTRVIYEQPNFAKNVKSDESKRLHVLFDETVDENVSRSSEKEEESKKRDSKGDKEPPKDDDQPSTSRKK